MPETNFTYIDLIQLFELIESSSHVTEFHLKVGDIELDIRRGPQQPPDPDLASSAQRAAPAPAAPISAGTPRQRDGGVSHSAGGAAVRSPMVGTFYKAPEPGAPPFVEVGQRVTPSTTVCIIEVMKLMSSIQAGYSGVVTQILVNDGEPVEVHQELMVIGTDA